MKITLPYPPSANRYWRYVSGVMVLSREAREYRKMVANSCLIQGVRRERHCESGPVSIKLAYFRPRKAGDLDNMLKQPLDALRGILYEDDKQISEIHAKRFDDKDRPRVEIEITPI